MRILCAPDSYKESMSAVDAAAAMARGIASVLPDADVVRVPLADGGEGTGATLVRSLGGELVTVPCTDALGRPADGAIGYIPARALAVIEVASACGLEHVEPHVRDARLTSTRGVGDLVLAALDLGVTTLLIGLGGSATNDAGTGMLARLGVRFLDSSGVPLPEGGASLANLASVDTSGLDPRLEQVDVRVACDVDNPLTGPCGASAVYGPQKGATPDAVTELDAALSRWADVVEPTVARLVRDVPGAGAAGGLGAAFLAFTRARLEPGAELVMDASGFDDHLQGADWVFTGEGSLDAQSAAGKVPVRVAARATAAGVGCIAFAGRVDAAIDTRPLPGILTAVPIVRGVTDLPHALAEGAINLERAVAMTCRLLTAHADDGRSDHAHR